VSEPRNAGGGVSELPLSVVLATTQPWPELAPLLRTVVPEVREIGGEVIVVDNNGRGLPADFTGDNPEVVWITERGASIFRMRSLGMSVARGEVIALTEDHCRPARGWCKAHLDAHAEHPEAAAVGGPVLNGATEQLSAWGSFLINHAEWMPPVESGLRPTIDRANISYKNWAVPKIPSRDGSDEPFLFERLQRAGATFVMDTNAPVTHDQAFGVRGTLTIHFHSGRSTAGARLAGGMNVPRRLLRAIASVALGPAMFVQTMRRIFRRPKSPRVLASLPMAFAVANAISFGLLVGYLAGPGDSARQIR
jgi:hypothetical protein